MSIRRSADPTVWRYSAVSVTMTIVALLLGVALAFQPITTVVLEAVERLRSRRQAYR